MKKRNRWIITALIACAIGVPILLRQWQLGSDRAACLMNMRNMHVTMYSYAGMKGVGPGESYPGGPRELLKLNPEYDTLPKCPSGGTYSFGSDTGYLIDLGENIQCSHAKDLNHFWPDEQQKDK